MKVSLTQKIFAGNFLLLAAIVGMVVILIHERGRMREIDSEVHDLQSVRNDIHAAQLYITELSLLGESLISQENADTANYRRKRLSTDSLLLALKPRCRQHVRPGQIDTLRHLLADKETHLFRVVEAIGMQDAADSILVNHLPEVAERATRIRTVRKRRDNLLGTLGAKKTVRILPSAGELHTFSDSLIAMQQEGTEEMETSADSLYARNLALNARLNHLIKHLDRQVQEAFFQREHKIMEAQSRSTYLFTLTLAVAILLLFLFHVAIHREIRLNHNEKKKREGLIDELQASNEKNRQLLQFRHNLMQTVSHEMRTALTAISGNAELLLRDEVPEDRVRHIRTVRESANRMTAMTTELLEFFRLEIRKEKLQVRPFRSESIAAVLKTEFAPLAEVKGIEFVTDNRAAEVLGGDKERILRIGSNLLSNAVKFTRSGRITLHTDYKDGQFILSVEDTGTGIRKEKQEQIFAPFERLGNAVTQDGFGLGLAIVSNLVQLMQGSASVESEPGKGSRFTVVLPLPRAEEVPEGEKAEDVRPSLAGCSVLAIDNDPVTLRLMREMYLQGGVSCDTCLTLAELTDRIRGKDYDLLITDLRMPEANGYEILELLRMSDIGNSRELPIVAATAAGYVSEEELKEAGFSGLLPKPFSIDELMETTRHCIREKRNRQPDFSALLAFGDKRKTLEQLMAETEKDMEEVRKASERKDMPALNGWIHHLRSSWMVIRTERTLQKLHEAIHKEPRSDEEIACAVRAVLEQGEIIIKAAGKEMKKWERLS